MRRKKAKKRCLMGFKKNDFDNVIEIARLMVYLVNCLKAGLKQENIFISDEMANGIVSDALNSYMAMRSRGRWK